MPIFAFKLFMTPIMIGLVTFAGRRWGAVISGLLIGLPLTSGPISFILACEFGQAFSAKAAIGSLAGEISVCMFCLMYACAAKRSDWLPCVCMSIGAFLCSTVVLNRVVWQLIPVSVCLVLVIWLVAKLIPQSPDKFAPISPPRWDLPARMVIATGFVILLTSLADALGPQLSGLCSPFPIYGIVFAAFTHAQQGARAAANLCRGIVLSAIGFASFFMVVGAVLTRLDMALTYLLATLMALAVTGIYYRVTCREVA